MSRKQKVLRLIISGTLLAAVALVGITAYRLETSQLDQLEMEENQVAEMPQPAPTEVPEDETEEEQPNHAVIDEEEEMVPEEMPQTQDTTSSDVDAQTQDAASSDVSAQSEDAASSDVSAQAEDTQESASADVQTPVLPELNFTEESLMQWPVNGEVLMDYSMDHTVYFPTLDVYKYNPSILVGANTGEPVYAAANSRIVNIAEATETGTTVTVDMGNGYQAVYGQLKDVQVSVDDVVSAGMLLGYVNDPTRFYSTEGTNLYFSMTKDGASIDPILYLP